MNKKEMQYDYLKFIDREFDIFELFSFVFVLILYNLGYSLALLIYSTYAVSVLVLGYLLIVKKLEDKLNLLEVKK